MADAIVSPRSTADHPARAELDEDGLILLDHAQGATRFLATLLGREDGKLAELAWLIADELENAHGALNRERGEGLEIMLERDRLRRELAGEAEGEGGAAAAKPIGRAFDLLTELDQRLRRLEAAA